MLTDENIELAQALREKTQFLDEMVQQIDTLTGGEAKSHTEIQRLGDIVDEQHATAVVTGVELSRLSRLMRSLRQERSEWIQEAAAMSAALAKAADRCTFLEGQTGSMRSDIERLQQTARREEKRADAAVTAARTLTQERDSVRERLEAIIVERNELSSEKSQCCILHRHEIYVYGCFIFHALYWLILDCL